MTRAALRSMRVMLASAALILTTSLNRDAHAQSAGKPAPSANAQSAIVLAKEAKDHYDRGEWKTALDLFVAAEGRAHSPVLLLYIARCRRNLGELLAAREHYRAIAAEALAPDAPAPFKAAREDAAADLRALEPRIPLLTIDRAALPSTATIEVDGRPLSIEELASGARADPGARVVRAMLEGKELVRSEVTLVEAATARVQLVPPAAQASADKPTPAPTPAPAHPAEPSITVDVVGVVAVVLGAGGLGAGIATRVMALGIVDDVRSRCVEGQCLASDEAEVERAVDLETFSTVGFIAGGVLAATGITLLIVSATSGPSVSVQAAPTALAILGRF